MAEEQTGRGLAPIDAENRTFTPEGKSEEFALRRQARLFS